MATFFVGKKNYTLSVQSKTRKLIKKVGFVTWHHICLIVGQCILKVNLHILLNCDEKGIMKIFLCSVLGLVLFSCVVFAADETTKSKSAADVLNFGEDSLSTGTDALSDDSSLEESVFNSFFQSGADALDGKNVFSTSSDLNNIFNETELSSSIDSFGGGKLPVSPWTVKEHSLYGSLKRTTDPYNDSVMTLKSLNEVSFEVESIDRNFNLFNERKEEPLRIISLWEEPVAKPTQDDSEPLSWGWSLKSERRPRPTKKSSLWD